MTKLMTSIAVLQCVEDGLLDLDADVKPYLPQIGNHGIITSFNEATNSADLTPLSESQRKITPRMLLSHTSGHEYDWFNPLLAQWGASRGEQPWTGPTVEDKSVLPLVFAPGEGFAYGAGHDWAGKLVEVVNGGEKTLEDFMRERIWRPLGIPDQDVGFLPAKSEELKKRMATLSSLDEAGNGPAFDLPGFDLLFGGEECLGGGGGYCTAEGYYTFLSAVLRQDGRLLRREESWEELFKPQLDEKLEGKLNEYLALSEMHENFLGFRIPRGVRKNWSFAGLVVVDGHGRDGGLSRRGRHFREVLVMM